AHVGEEPRLHLVGAPERVGLLVQLRVEREDTAIGVLELRVQARELLLPLTERVEDTEQLLVLLPDLFQGTPRDLTRESLGDGRELAWGDLGRPAGEELAERDGDPGARLIRDLEMIDQPPGSEHADTHSGRGAIAAGEDAVELPDAGSPIAHPHQEQLRRVPTLHEDLDLPPTRVHEGVARDLRHRGGDAGLALTVEAQPGRDLTRPLANRDDVLLVADEERCQQDAHVRITPPAAGRPRPGPRRSGGPRAGAAGRPRRGGRRPRGSSPGRGPPRRARDDGPADRDSGRSASDWPARRNASRARRWRDMGTGTR